MPELAANNKNGDASWYASSSDRRTKSVADRRLFPEIRPIKVLWKCLGIKYNLGSKLFLSEWCYKYNATTT
jgi:hypothetical protein